MKSAVADGKLGNEEGAPYDCIHVGAAAAGRLHSANKEMICTLLRLRSYD